MYEAFIEKRFSAESTAQVHLINGILQEYQGQGYRLSLRQLYYQLVARGHIPNNIRSYKNTGTLVSNARQAGLIDWDMIEDRNRETVIPSHWRNPGEIIHSAAYSFHINKWEDQPYHVEVMVEKDALSGVLQPVCKSLDIGITANKGYSSSSTMYEIGKRLSRMENLKNGVIVFYLGDHDPSGIDMTRDVRERLLTYSRLPSDFLEVQRLALNFDQVVQWNPPENPAKETDARYSSYAFEYGESSWELDAIEPSVLASLVEDAVKQYRDEDLWEEAVSTEAAMIDQLNQLANNY